MHNSIKSSKIRPGRLKNQENSNLSNNDAEEYMQKFEFSGKMSAYIDIDVTLEVGPKMSHSKLSSMLGSLETPMQSPTKLPMTFLEQASLVPSKMDTRPSNSSSTQQEKTAEVGNTKQHSQNEL